MIGGLSKPCPSCGAPMRADEEGLPGAVGDPVWMCTKCSMIAERNPDVLEYDCATCHGHVVQGRICSACAGHAAAVTDGALSLVPMNSDRAEPLSNVTAGSILLCDVCQQPIDDLQYAMLFWEPDTGGPITGLIVAHKSIEGRRCDDDSYELSMELWWFADPEAALARLADLVTGYRWTAKQLQRLALVAWACPFIGEKHARAAREHDRMGL